MVCLHFVFVISQRFSFVGNRVIFCSFLENYLFHFEWKQKIFSYGESKSNVNAIIIIVGTLFLLHIFFYCFPKRNDRTNLQKSKHANDPLVIRSRTFEVFMAFYLLIFVQYKFSYVYWFFMQMLLSFFYKCIRSRENAFLLELSNLF